MNNIFFTADTHFGHARLLGLGKGRPFATIEEHDEALIDNWNKTVGRGDLVYHLGDFSFLNRVNTEQVLGRLQGQIHFIAGNHDRGTMKRFVPQLASYQQYKEIKVGEQRLILFHFPIVSWHQVHKGSWHLHGHTHGNLEYHNGPMLDVGVDCFRFTPVSFEEVAARLHDQRWEPLDQHRPD